MKCTKCNHESDQDFSFCPNCGSKTLPASAHQSPVVQKILSALQDRLFLAICILLSASCILSLASDDLPIIHILATVFLWLTYAQGRKNIADAKHLRCVSGTVYAQYIITYVLAGIFLFVGVIFAIAFSFLFNDPAYLNTVLSGFMDIEEYDFLIQSLAVVSGGLILFVFALIAAIMVVVNIFSLRYIHRFMKSVYQSVESGEFALKHVKITQILLFIMGGLSSVGALSSLVSEQLLNALNNGVSSAIGILAGLLIGRHLSCKE